MAADRAEMVIKRKAQPEPHRKEPRLNLLTMKMRKAHRAVIRAVREAPADRAA